MALAEPSPEGTPVAKRRKIETATEEDYGVKTIELGMYINTTKTNSLLCMQH